MFAREHGLKIGTIADLIEYRSRNESLIERVGAAHARHARRASSTAAPSATAPAACTWR